MPSFCSVVGCSKRAERDKVRFFRFPAALKNSGDNLNALSKERRECWVKSLKRGHLNETFLKNARICSLHFITGEPAALPDKNNPDWIPSQNMGYISLSGTKNIKAVDRHVRMLNRCKRLRSDEVGPSTSINPTEELTESYVEREVDSSSISIEVQTDICMEDMEKLFMDLNFANSKIYSLQDKLKGQGLCEESFMNNDTKSLYFTGFPKTAMMLLVFNSIRPYLSVKTILCPFLQFLLTLMKLRLNLPFKYLSYRFSVSPQTASETFYTTLDILYGKYRKLVFWPDRFLLKQNVPACFKENFGDRVAVIIDCFEIFTETPSGFLNAARCWSNYKHHQTVKFLIGITPQGTISYISEAWGGRTSDKFLTENCGILNFILPDDIVLADRGFLIADSVEILGGHLETPAFTKSKNQLHPTDLESTRNIASVRIHVERVIGLLKRKFKICQGPIPISMLSVNSNNISALDKIIAVCSAFINLCPSQIPL